MVPALSKLPEKRLGSNLVLKLYCVMLNRILTLYLQRFFFSLYFSRARENLCYLGSDLYDVPKTSRLVSAPFPSGKCNSFVVIYMTYQKPHVWFPPQSKAAYVLFYQRRRSHRVSVLSDKGEGASGDVMAAADDDWVDEGEDEDMDTK